jgi:hypothetical protein
MKTLNLKPMKKLLVLSSLFLSVSLFAQPGKKGKEPKMAPELVPGYYVPMKGDTVKGEVQTNLENEGDFYKSIYFKPANSQKVIEITTKKAKAYGFGDKHFAVAPYDGSTDVYLRYLAKGRLNLMEYKYATTKGGSPVVESEYYIQDTQADDENKQLRDLKKLSMTFYKKELKTYMKDQPMIWNDLDKFTFKPEAVANSIREYNRFYEGSKE